MEFLSYRDPVKDKAYTFLVYSTDKFNELLYKRYVKICNDENLDDCIKYTGLFEIHNNTKYFIYKINNTFIRVEDCKLARDINRWSVAKEKIKIKKNSIVKRYLNDVDFFRIFDTGVNFQELLKLVEICFFLFLFSIIKFFILSNFSFLLSKISIFSFIKFSLKFLGIS